MRKFEYGFTLIELLIVIAIIGILSTVVTLSFVNAQKIARDAKRKSDLKQIRTALELYYNDKGFYPPSSCGYDCNGYYYSTGGNDWIPGLSAYMNGSVPVDPKNSGGAPWGATGYIYAYGNVGKAGNKAGKFDLTAHLENTSDPDRCEIKCWKYGYWGSGGTSWCPGVGGTCGGAYSNQVYEDSPN